MALHDAGAQRAAEAGGPDDGDPMHGATLRSRPARPRSRCRALGDLLVGERAVGRAELQPQRQRAVALPHLLALVDVEHLGAGQQLAPGLAHHGADGLGGLTSAGGHHGDVLAHGREAASRRANCGDCGAASASASKSSSNAAPPSRSHVARDQRMQLADPAQLALVAGVHARRSGRGAGTAARPGAAKASSSRAAAPHGLHEPLGGEEVAGHGVAAPGPGAAWVTRAARWWRSAAGRRPPGLPSGGVQVAAGPVHVRGLEQRERAGAVGRVVARGVEQPRQQQRAHHAAGPRSAGWPA